MPLSKSSRSSKSSRPSLLSLPSVHSLLSNSSHDRDAKSSGGSSPARARSADTEAVDELGAEKLQRRKSRLNVLTSFFATPSSRGSTLTDPAGPIPSLRPKTATEASPPTHLRKEPIPRRPVASTIELATRPPSSDGSPNSLSNPHDSVSTIDNSPGAAAGPGIQTPVTQASDCDFGFGVEHTEFPEAADTGAETHTGQDMPQVIQKQPRAVSADGAPPLPPKDPLPKEQPPAPVSPVAPKSRGSARSSSAHQSSPDRRDGPAKLQSTRRSSPVPRVRSSSAQPSTHREVLGDAPQATSNPADAVTYPRPMSKQSNDGSDSRGRLRRSWLPGRPSSGSKDLKKMSPSKAWILSADNQADYNTAFLANNEKVPELWAENGDVHVYLSPKASGKGPSFKVSSQAIEASVVFHELIQGELSSSRAARDRSRSFDGRDNLTARDADRQPHQQLMPEPADGVIRLYLPPAAPDQLAAQDPKTQPELQRLVAIRNLFAFLTGQPLVATKFRPTIFSAFLEISSLLKEFDFMSMDGTTWGEGVDLSFGFYMSQLSLADVRHSREKTLEAVILGERMKCWELYNEAFTHAVGKWQAIVSLKSPLAKQVSPEVWRRLERSNLDLLNRQHNVNSRLEEFEFPALFSGVAGSSEFKDIRFNRWKSSFSRMRGFTLGYYKSLFGAWPPKARSKKNPFSESGLNRLVLKTLYADLSSLYDLLVDRDSVTPRVIDQAVEDIISDKESNEHIRALRKLLTEFDQSSPPVLPPIPYDIPILPTMKTVQVKYDEMKEKDQLKFDRNIKDHELQLIMHKSYNFDADSVKSPFLLHFKEFDHDQAKGRSQAELVDNRLGIWLFLYVVIQSLPLLVIDAPDLQFTEGVEYFLCQPPMGNPPWLEEAGEVRKAWYQLPGSQVKVELSADVVMFSVEGTFERSHCWEAAKAWEEAKVNGGSAGLVGMQPPPPLADGAAGSAYSPLEAPRAVFEDNDPVMGMGGTGGYHSSNGNSPASSAPPSPASGPQRRVISPNSGLAAGRGAGSNFRASFAGLSALEPLAPPAGAAPVDRRSSRVYSFQVAQRQDSLGPDRPQSPGDSAPGTIRNAKSVDNMRGEVPARKPVGGGGGGAGKGHNHTLSSTFDDILKDMGNQQKPAKQKKKFGF
ncbi:hypothetical protein KVR01_000815 [Diaporthe batatas]|uniref:uncharacterized protein n=1 Tax=Diaporthe batatas TaxID=748121 RepID=UPI001D04ABBC|nr:uncharacterized protein KVR01_000815 [Diaporthe batatas]KAG8170070.1 hypothetical protein KVR01_000815 [Diaporthe batatas]